MDVPPELRRQIEAAFDYRGHVTVRLKDGTAIEGFLFNRMYEHPKGGEGNYVDLVMKNKDLNRRVPLDRIAAVELTGEDCAAGKSYADYMAKKAKGPAAA